VHEMLCTEGLSDVYCFFVLWNETVSTYDAVHRLSFRILIYFVLSKIVLNAFFEVLHFGSSGNPNKHCPLEMDSDVCEFDRYNAFTNIESLLCFHYSLLACDAILRTIGPLP
jgi:hypothetical protein